MLVAVSLLAAAALLVPAAHGNEVAYDEGRDTRSDVLAQRDASAEPDTSASRDPALTASVDWMFLKRGELDDTPVFTTAAGANIFNASQFKFDFKSGVDMSLRYRLTPCFTLEGRYLLVDKCRDEVGPFPLSPADRARTTPPAHVGNETDWVFYDSQFQSVEINLRGAFAGRFDVRVLAGVRYVRFDETFRNTYTETGTGVTGVWIQATENDLIGFQLGAEALIWEIGPGLRLDVRAKGGAYFNSADSSAGIRDSTGWRLKASDDKDRRAFLAELGFLFSYKINSNFSGRLGYHLIWLDDVAAAAEQIPRTTDWEQSVVPFATTTDRGNTAYFHGLFLGFELRF
jgi:hypothetical protein